MREDRKHEAVSPMGNVVWFHFPRYTRSSVLFVWKRVIHSGMQKGIVGFCGVEGGGFRRERIGGIGAVT